MSRELSSVSSRAMGSLFVGWIVSCAMPLLGDIIRESEPVRDVLLYCSFDGTIEPAIQRGAKGSNPIGPIEYTKGIKGKAVITTHLRGVTFPVKGNINITEGTVKFWVTPMDWKAGDGLFHHFFRIVDEKPEGAKSARVFDLVLYKFCEWDSVVAFGMSGELTGSNLLQIPMDDGWVPKRWHQIAFTWDNQGASLYVDGKGKHQKYLRGAPDTLTAESFIVGGPYFIANDTSTAIDELTIYSRRFSDKEIDDLYKTELIEGAMRR